MAHLLGWGASKAAQAWLLVNPQETDTALPPPNSESTDCYTLASSLPCHLFSFIYIGTGHRSASTLDKKKPS